MTYNPHGLVFYLITDFVEFPDYPLWEIFISHDSLPFEMNPVPVNIERTLQWLERQVMPSIVMIEEIDRLTGSNYMKRLMNVPTFPKNRKCLWNRCVRI